MGIEELSANESESASRASYRREEIWSCISWKCHESRRCTKGTSKTGQRKEAVAFQTILGLSHRHAIHDTIRTDSNVSRNTGGRTSLTSLQNTEYTILLRRVQMLVALERWAELTVKECCWHYSALRGSDHIDFLLDHRLLKPVSTSSIESIYNKYADSEKTSFDFVTRAEIEQGNVKHEQLLLPTGAHSIVASTLNVPELSGEVERAVWQVDQESQKLAAQDAAKSQEVSAEEKKKDQWCHNLPGTALKSSWQWSWGDDGSDHWVREEQLCMHGQLLKYIG